jgi:thioredoxin 1
MLYTNLKHIENAAEQVIIINKYREVVIICGNMGPMCILVFRVAEELETEYKDVKFYDMEFDNPESEVIRKLPDVSGFSNIPFTIWYKDGKVVNARSGIQTKAQMATIMDQEFAVSFNA